jgi:hypothetical protein
MRNLMVLLLLAGCLGRGQANAADIGGEDRAEIQRVISAQIAAFRNDDGDAALRFAAPGLQRKFGDGGRFLAIVREDYPAVFRPRSFHFGAVAPGAAGLAQRVDIIGPDGEAVVATYDMEHEQNGDWRIAGCSVTKTDQIEL